jgi:CHAT domain-containing protein
MQLWTRAGRPGYAIFFGKLSVNSYQALRASTQGMDRASQQSFVRSVEGVYREVASLLIGQGRFSEAQQALDSFKNQQYFDRDSAKGLAPLTFTAREAEFAQALDQQITDWVSCSEKSAASIQGNEPCFEASVAFKQKLENAGNVFDDQHSEAQASRQISEIQSALSGMSRSSREEAVAVYTVSALDKYQSLIITKTGVAASSIDVRARDLDRKAASFWKMLRTPRYDPRAAAKELYDIVFAPIEAKLPKGTKTILWSLDGNLRYIPIAALYDGKKYLVERYQNVVFTRVDKEQMTREPARDVTGAGFGSSEEHTVEVGGDRLTASALPQVKTELARIFGGPDSNGRAVAGDVLLDERFTKPAMLAELAKRRPLVHIASHFRFEPGDEARSFLLMGDGTAFTLDEMKRQQDLFKGVDLLTLSACETAAQKPDANGREVDGFAELAQRLGASAVMASLWEVSDSSTAELMARFYADYAGPNRGRMTKAAALRSAQLALLKGKYDLVTDADRRLRLERPVTDGESPEKAKLIPFKPKKGAPFAHPFYWSPFILIGNWR